MKNLTFFFSWSVSLVKYLLLIKSPVSLTLWVVDHWNCPVKLSPGEVIFSKLVLNFDSNIFEAFLLVPVYTAGWKTINRGKKETKQKQKQKTSNDIHDRYFICFYSLTYYVPARLGFIQTTVSQRRSFSGFGHKAWAPKEWTYHKRIIWTWDKNLCVHKARNLPTTPAR